MGDTSQPSTTSYSNRLTLIEVTCLTVLGLLGHAGSLVVVPGALENVAQ